MLKAYKYRLYPSEEQKEHFVQAMGCARYIYNKALKTKVAYYDATKQSLSKNDLINIVLMAEKNSHDWLELPNAQSLQMSIRNLDEAFSRFFKKVSGFPQLKKKRNNVSIQYPQRVAVDFKNSKVKIPKAGLVFCRFDRKFVGKIKTCTVSKTATNKFFISILVEEDKLLPAKQPITIQTTIGIDLGLKHFAVLSDGTVIDNPKYLQQNLQRLKVLQHRASKKQKGSNNRRKANLQVAILYETITNQRKDFLHKLSTKLVSENQTIVLEDLNIAGMLKNHKLALAISSVSWSQIIRQITYKAEWNGKNIIHIGRWDASSKLCSCCGWKNTELKLADREWVCGGCGKEHDRDFNAAVNIKNFGLVKAGIISGKELPEELVEMLSNTATVVSNSKTNQRSKKQLLLGQY